MARRLAPTTQQTYRRDLDCYVLPRFGSYRLGHLPADEVENRLNDEVASSLAARPVHRHYRALRRVLQVAVEEQRQHRSFVFTDLCSRRCASTTRTGWTGWRRH
ncbi:MAG TPA: hypothetical protein VK428_05110 [Acidimicrobiales bacterium]|nr:hypothetical protein [Acidimicrobiales bacterium]